MKKLLYPVLALVLLSANLSACSDNKSSTGTNAAAGSAPVTDSAATPTSNPDPGLAAATYTCPMHPEVVTNAPGQCPKCNMDLVKK